MGTGSLFIVCDHIYPLCIVRMCVSWRDREVDGWVGYIVWVLCMCASEKSSVVGSCAMVLFFKNSVLMYAEDVLMPLSVCACAHIHMHKHETGAAFLFLAYVYAWMVLGLSAKLTLALRAFEFFLMVYRLSWGLLFQAHSSPICKTGKCFMELLLDV